MANNNRTSQTSDIGSEVLKITKILDGMVKSFRRFWWIVILLVIIGAGGFYLYSRMTFVPKYQAYSSFAISASSSYGTTADYYNQRAVKQLNNSFPYIISSGVLMEAVAEDIGVRPVPATITTDAIGSTAIFTIRVTADDPETADNVLQSVLTNYPRIADIILGNTVLTQIDESGVPSRPINSSGTKKKAMIGGVLGLIVGILLLLILSLRRRTVITEQDIKEFISLPMLGTVPEVKFKKRGRKSEMKVLIDKNESGQALAESMHSIRTRLISELEKNNIHSFLISSALAGEGKTTFAVNLSISLARHGYKVILVDGDLRNPSVAGTLEIDNQAGGTIDALNDPDNAKDYLVRYGKYKNFRILLGGQKTNNPTKFLASPEMRKMLRVLAKDADLLIVDAAPSGLLHDATLMAPFLDGALMVVRQDYANKEQIIAGFETLASTNIHMLGYVLNYMEGRSSRYGYGYGYGYRYGYGYGYGSKYGYGEDTGEEETEEPVPEYEEKIAEETPVIKETKAAKPSQPKPTAKKPTETKTETKAEKRKPVKRKPVEKKSADKKPVKAKAVQTESEKVEPDTDGFSLEIIDYSKVEERTSRRRIRTTQIPSASSEKDEKRK